MAFSWSGGRVSGAALIVMGVALGGCASNAIPGMSSLSSMFGSSQGEPAAAGDQPQQSAGGPSDTASFACPTVRVRTGAATYRISANPSDPSPTNLRYQVGLDETARECRRVGPNVVMRVGVQGRVIVGPQGGPGRITVPLRLAVVHEGVNPRPVVSDLYRIDVVLPQGDTNQSFTHVEDNLTFPMPPGAEIDSYVVYVGFDPLAGRR